MEQYLQEEADRAAHPSHTGDISTNQRFSDDGINRGENGEAMHESEENFTAFEKDSEQLANQEAAKAWEEEKIRRQKGILGVPAADARIGALPEHENEVEEKEEEEAGSPPINNGNRKATKNENEDDDADREWLDNDGKDTSLLINDEQEWEVEAIIDAKLVKHRTRKGEPKDVCYKVTYKGNWPKWNAKPPWQCKEDLVHCADLVRKFHRDNPKKPGAHRAYSFMPDATETRKRAQAAKEVAKTTADGNEQAVEQSAQNEGNGKRSQIIEISSDSSSSTSPGPSKLTKNPIKPASRHGNPPSTSQHRSRSTLTITLAPGEPLQALGPMGLLGGRPNDNGPIAQFRRMFDASDPDDELRVQKKKKDGVVRLESETKEPKRRKRKGDADGEEVVSSKSPKKKKLIVKKASVATVGKTRTVARTERAFEDVLEEVGEVGDIDINEFDF